MSIYFTVNLFFLKPFILTLYHQEKPRRVTEHQIHLI